MDNGRIDLNASSEPDRREPEIKALSKALDVLMLFTPERAHWSLRDIIERTGIPRSTAYRIVKTLEMNGLLRIDPITNTYLLGDGMLQLTDTIAALDQITPVLHGSLEQLAVSAGEDASLLVEAELGHAVLIDYVQAPGPVALPPGHGRVIHGLAHSACKVFAAYGPEEKRRQLATRANSLAEYSGVTDQNNVLAVLDEVLRTGTGFDLDETTLGVSSVAAPVFGARGAIAAAVVLTVPSERFSPPIRAALAEKVLAAARTMSELLGWQEPYPGWRP